VVPCFNESEVLPETARRLADLIDKLVAGGQASGESCVVFVDDGSADDTWTFIEQLSEASGRFRGIKLARNFGHQSAILAGMLVTAGDAIITIDADLQDPPEAIGQMVEKYRSGADIVFGVRNDRTSDSQFKRATARGFYRLMRGMGIDLVSDHADYRLLSRAAIEALKQYSEVNLFLRGLIPIIGYRQETVFYKREARFAGVSKYGLGKMLALAVNGVTSFSIFPLRLITLLGISISVLAFVAGLWSLVVWMAGATLPGWTSIVLPMYLLGGFQLLAIGILGEYLGKTYFEAKRRPRFVIEKRTG
jgi:glycosyltransferase involved in cell wall biosynthesis